MLDREFQGLRLSALGMGTVRLPLLSQDKADLDLPALERMVDTAMAQGINYYDLGWDYHGGRAEGAVAQSLLRYPRETYYLASKFPGYHKECLPKAEEVFEEQLRRCGVEFFDFYMLHNVCEMTIADYLNPEYGILPFLLRQKELGRIRHLGFSTHGEVENIKEFLDAAGQHMEFCQIQLNWMDWTFQRAGEKAALLHERNIPIWVMEPLRGGKLLNMLKKEDKALLTSLRPEESIYAWGLRFLQDIPGVTVVLSGCSSVEQILENCATYSEEKPLTAREKEALQSLAEKLIAKRTLPCTACGYCLGQCPQGLNIPKLLELCNENILSGGGFVAPRAVMSLPEAQRPHACVGCRACEQVCPQGIQISEVLAELAKKSTAFFAPKA